LDVRRKERREGELEGVSGVCASRRAPGAVIKKLGAPGAVIKKLDGLSRKSRDVVE
jgi:hypothetical protein